MAGELDEESVWARRNPLFGKKPLSWNAIKKEAVKRLAEYQDKPLKERKDFFMGSRVPKMSDDPNKPLKPKVSVRQGSNDGKAKGNLKKGEKWSGKHNDGRPSSTMTEAVLVKLDMAYKIGATDEEAACFADIPFETLQSHISRNPDYKKRRKQLQMKPILKAKNALVRGLEDPYIALKYLERKKRDEFAVRTEAVTTTEPVKIVWDLGSAQSGSASISSQVASEANKD